MDRPVVCITMGYPAGIGTEVISKALASPEIERIANFLIIGDEFAFKKALSVSKKTLRYKLIKGHNEIDFSKEGILFLDLQNILPAAFSFGVVSQSLGKASIDYVREAVAIIKKKKAHILVTAPIHKYAAELSGFKYPGHTEYLAHLAGVKEYAMMFISGVFKIVLVTIHLPLRDVSRVLKRKRIVTILKLTNLYLRRYFGIVKPRIAVCGLNPHAGENGMLGDEEKKIITPAITGLKENGMDIYGPVAADALFYDLYKGRYDAAICMYHDQGLVALKMIARDESVNITLGLPFIRTSPAHGTALDIAGKGSASGESMKRAIETAVGMYNISHKL